MLLAERKDWGVDAISSPLTPPLFVLLVGDGSKQYL